MSSKPSTRSTEDRTTEAGDRTQHDEPAAADAGASTAEDGAEADGGQAEQTECAPLSRDLIFDALQNSRRREALRYLVSQEGSATLGELAEHIAAIENDTTVQALSSQQRKRVYVGLYQGHLPKLDDMGVVDFDQDRGDVTLGPAAPQLFPYMPAVGTDERRPWSLYYLGAATVGLVALGVGTLGGVLDGTGATVLAIAVVACLAALAVVHALEGE